MFRRYFGTQTPYNLIIRELGNVIQIGKQHKIVNNVKSTSDLVKLRHIINPEDPLSTFLEVQKRCPNMELEIEFRHGSSQLAWFFPEYYHIKFNQNGEIDLIEDVTPEI